MRALATIRKVSELKPIEGADRIEICMMKGLGWEVVVKKDELKKDDTVVFFEIDSVLPVEEKYEFLRKSSYKKWEGKEGTDEGFVLKTVKLKGVVSQGLVLPVSDFPELKDVKEKEDVTEKLNIRLLDDIKAKYNKGSRAVSGTVQQKKKERLFPYFIRKTDQERIQNKMEYFEDLKSVHFVAEQKYDGSSTTVFYVNDKKKYKTENNFGVCSRNLLLPKYGPSKKEILFDIWAQKAKKGKWLKTIKYKIKDTIRFLLKPYKRELSDSNFWQAINATGVEEALSLYCKKWDMDLALQGETVGPKMNGNRDKYDKLEWYVFDIFDIREQKYMSAHKRHIIISEINSLISDETKKIKEVRTLKSNWAVFNDLSNLHQMLEWVDMLTERGNPQEGVVFKSLYHEPYTSFKCINNKYLLAEKESEEE